MQTATTRPLSEQESLRRQSLQELINLGIDPYPAATFEVGAYSTEVLEQFEIEDERTPFEIREMLKGQGYEAVWKDWDRSFSSQSEKQNENEERNKITDSSNV